MSEKICVYDPLIELMARFENVRVTDDSVDPFAGLSVEDSLRKHIVDGVKKGLDGRLLTALETRPALSIINDVLLDGMKTVGELFGAGKMQLPFVLQSAEVMKAAVRTLEPYLERTEGSEKGSILLATVAGDVHDIGKNLVDIILTNNGYKVVNIGIKQPINAILDAWHEHRTDAIGLSGLLVKSTVIMRENLLEMNSRGLSHVPVILGGAALTRAYVEEDLRGVYEGRVAYAQDAFEGLKWMGALDEIPSGSDDEVTPRVRSHRTDGMDEALYVFDGVSSAVEPMAEPPALPFYGSRTYDRFDLRELAKYVNPIALFRGQWQLKRPDGMPNAEATAWIESQGRPVFDRLLRELGGVLKPRVTWGYFPCASEGNSLLIYEEDGATERERFVFPRQRDGKRLCLADFFLPVDVGRRDTVAFHLVTVGSEVSVKEREHFAKGEFREYLHVHGMGVEMAEALAEYWHLQIRRELGIDDAEPEDRRLLFSAKYHGARYSFGYPACPNLEDQSKLMRLLKPDRIGVALTDEFMLEPEQSTSAIIVHHPSAKYFNVK